MNLSEFLTHTLSVPTLRARAAVNGADAARSPNPDSSLGGGLESLARYQDYRRMLRGAEVRLPAALLANRAVATWVRDQRVGVDVRSGTDLAAVAAAGLPYSRATVFADALSESELRAVADQRFGRVVAGTVPQVEMLRSVGAHQQDVVIRMSDAGVCVHAVAGGAPCGFRFDSAASDAAIAAIIDHDKLRLVGLHCDIGGCDDDFISYPAAIGQMIAKMTQIRLNHGVLLARLGLGVGRTLPPATRRTELRWLATEIDESVDDACETLRYPRPLVVLTTSVDIGQRSAA